MGNPSYLTLVANTCGHHYVGTLGMETGFTELRRDLCTEPDRVTQNYWQRREGAGGAVLDFTQQ